MSKKVNNISVDSNKCHVPKNQMEIFISSLVCQYLPFPTSLNLPYPYVTNHPYEVLSVFPQLYSNHMCVLIFQNRWVVRIRVLVWIYCLTEYSFILQYCHLTKVKVSMICSSSLTLIYIYCIPFWIVVIDMVFIFTCFIL